MAYELFLACERGNAPYVERELDLKGFKGETTSSATTVVVKGLSKEDLIKAAYLLQTPTRIGWLLGQAEVTLDTEESVVRLEMLIGTLDLQKILVKDKTFLVHCDREGAHEYNSIDLSQEAGRLIKRHAKEALGWVPGVDLKHPDTLLHLHVDDEQAWFSLDLVGKDASKRAYKVFNNPHSVKGPTAACLVFASGWTPGKDLLDPYASGGVIAIEAALTASGQSLHFYDKSLLCRQHPLFQDRFAQVTDTIDAARRDVDAKTISAYDAQLRNVSAARKNAKIAGVDKYITFSKMDVEWLDTKMAAKSVHYIVTQPVEASKNVPEDKAMTLHKQLFYQADFILRDGGSITFLCQRPEDLVHASQEYGFIVQEQHQVFTGKLPRWIITFARKK